MKYKQSFLLLLFLFVSGLIGAQPRFDVGIHGGPILSTVPGFSNTNLMKLSGCAGFMVTRRDNKKNYAQLEINYIRKGSFRVPEEGKPDKINFSLHYVEAPLVYRFENLKISRKGKGGWETGISYARLIAPQLRRNGTLTDFDPIWSDKYDLSLLAGAHIIFANHIMIRTRISYSVNPILRRNILPNEIENFSSPRTHNITVQFGVAFLLRGLYY